MSDYLATAGEKPFVMTAGEAEGLARLLRELCILGEGRVLHVGGHVIGPLKKLPPKRRPTRDGTSL